MGAVAGGVMSWLSVVLELLFYFLMNSACFTITHLINLLLRITLFDVNRDIDS